MTRNDNATVRRFSNWARLQHASVIVLFFVLVVTGLPQKWPGSDVSAWLVDAMGGIFATRWIHRVAGIALALLTVAHLAVAVGGVFLRRFAPTMIFTRKDFQDAVESLAFYLGRREKGPRYGRYDYKQKFEYWGLIFGNFVMVATGFLLFFPVFFARLLPAQLIPAAKEMHTNEAMLALLTIVVWHFYSVLVSPEVFPLDTSIFTGRISKERLHHEHALEYEELFPEPPTELTEEQLREMLSLRDEDVKRETFEEA